MKALVVYESMYGNTRDAAIAISEGIAEHMQSSLLEVGVAPRSVPADIGLMVVGAPTHQFGMNRVSSREMARRDALAELVSPGIGVREWLDELGRPDFALPVAAFSTILEKPRLLRYAGTAGRSIEKRLGRLGFDIISPRLNLEVISGTGPLRAGEIERSRQWGRELGARMVTVHHREAAGSVP